MYLVSPAVQSKMFCFFRFPPFTMARLLKWVSGLIRYPCAVTHMSTEVVTAQGNMAQLFLPRLHSAAFISTSMRVHKKNISQHGMESPAGHDATKGLHRSERNQDAKKAKEKFLQMNAVIDDNDLDIKIKKIRNWLGKGYHVKVKIMINQRNMEQNKKVCYDPFVTV